MQDAYVGQVAAYPGQPIPFGWLPCDGKLLPIAQYESLYQVIGTKYGGGGNMFALPTIADPVANVVSIIAAKGEIPPPGITPPWAPNIMAMASPWTAPPPKYTMHPKGQVLEIGKFEGLFVVVQNIFGGNIEKGTFALPKMGDGWAMYVGV